MYLQYGTGAFNEIFVVEMLDNGLQNGAWAAVSAFAFGFLIARVLEGPLVGILDIGGSIMTGIGIGFPAVLLTFDQTSEIIKNPLFGLIVGLTLGMLVGALIIFIRYFARNALELDLGTSVMMGAGNQTGAFLGPLIVVTAAMFNPITGIGAALGAIIFRIWNKAIVGGAILGAMFLGIIPLLLR